MLSSAQVVSPKPAALPPAAQPALPSAGSAGGPSFAQFLNDQPDLLPPPAHTDPAPGKPDADSEASAAPASAAPTAPTRRKEASATPPKSTAQPQGRAPEATDAAKPAATAQATGDDTDATAAPAEDDTDTTQAAGLAEFTQLIGLVTPVPQAQPTQAPAVELPAAGTDAQASGVKGTSTARSAHAGRAADVADAAQDSDGKSDASAADTESTANTATERKPTETAARVADVPRAKAIDLAADRAAASRSAASDAVQATAAKQSEAAPRAVAPTDAVTPSFAAVLAQALPGSATAPAAAPATPTSQVHAALHSNAFGPELAASVSLLAVDGVQHAELQLNPADMGPVAVQIVVDGAQAQVSFHAVQAETRQALEQSLPDLAAALQGQGLTLSGGGVFQQSSRDAGGGDAEARSAEDRASRGSANGGGRVAATGAATAQVRRAAGLLDTFA